MENRYVGDVGDFGKYGLLRWLTGMKDPTPPDKEPLRLGVVWYLHTPENNEDGKFIGYLKNKKLFRECDCELYKSLGQLVENSRNVLAVEEAGILQAVAYYKTLLCQKTDRIVWREGALNAINEKEANLVFVDPDNGIVSGTVSPSSTKHVSMDDLECFANPNKSLVIYHHLRRFSTHDQQKHLIRSLAKELRTKFPKMQVWSLRYRRGSPGRAYFIVAQAGEHQRLIRKQLDSFLISDWCAPKRKLFELVE